MEERLVFKHIRIFLIIGFWHSNSNIDDGILSEESSFFTGKLVPADKSL